MEPVDFMGLVGIIEKTPASMIVGIGVLALADTGCSEILLEEVLRGAVKGRTDA